jgi:hypothetical protein
MNRTDVRKQFGQAGASNPSKEATLMKLNPTAMGNALGGATAILYAICAIFAYSAPDFVISLAKSFVHVLDLSPLTKSLQPFDIGRFAIGWIALSAYMWIFGWLFGTIYNASTKSRGTA